MKKADSEYKQDSFLTKFNLTVAMPSLRIATAEQINTKRMDAYRPRLEYIKKLSHGTLTYNGRDALLIVYPDKKAFVEDELKQAGLGTLFVIAEKATATGLTLVYTITIG